MDTNTIAMIILFATFMIFMVLRVPVTFSMLGACVLTALYLGPKYVSSVFLRLGDGVQSFSFLAIPFFIFAGDIMAEGGISDRLVEVANVMVGRFRGGLAYVNVIASTFFGGISGSPTADVSSLGPIEIGMMTKSGYDKDFSVATTVATATQALIIPPSHNMIIYGMAAGGLSTGKLFLAGIGPGPMLCAAMCILVARITRKRGYPRGPKYTVRESLKIVSDGFLGVMTIVIILLGVCTGLFTTTESAAIACVYALFVTLFIYKSIKVKDIWRIAKKSLGTLAMILSIIAAANAFCYLMSLMQVPAKITQMLLTVSDNKYVVLILINILLLIVGCFMDTTPAMMVLSPILLPVATSLGLSPIHFGIIMVVNLAIGFITPPLGINLFVAARIGDVKLEVVCQGIIRFIIAMIVCLLAITFIPAISEFLPRLSGML